MKIMFNYREARILSIMSDVAIVELPGSKLMAVALPPFEIESVNYIESPEDEVENITEEALEKAKLFIKASWDLMGQPCSLGWSELELSNKELAAIAYLTREDRDEGLKIAERIFGGFYYRKTGFLPAKIHPVI